ncbi:MAG: hypothetical protein LBP69_10565 [Treponema sp.]|jgi:hypothetical protein|nr:hypothetical protein [Treponema sp.]
MKTVKPAFFAVTVFLCGTLYAENIKPFIMPSARAAGFGGIHAAQGDDFSSLFSNPASFVGIEKQFSAAELSISLYGPVFELLDLAVNSSGTVNISPLVGPGGFAAGFDIGGPVAFGWVGGGLGVGIFNRTTTDARVTSARIRPVAAEEILLLGGYSFRVVDELNHKLDLGFLGKGYYRGMLDLESSILNVTEMFDDMGSRPFETHFGLGLDLGINYSFAGKLTLALAGYDVFSPALVTRYGAFSDYGSGGRRDYATVTPRLALGALYRIQNDFLDRYLSDFIVMLDYRDVLDPFVSLIPRNPILNISLGAEIKLLEILSVRAGIAEALPALGFGLDMKILQFDFAMRGKEIGLDPGVQSVYAIDIGFLFRY